MTLEPPIRTAMLSAMPKLRAFAISLCRNGDQAEDLVQDTLLRACANIMSFTRGTNMLAWLCTILKNHFLSHCRRRCKRSEDPRLRAPDTPIPASVGDRVARRSIAAQWAWRRIAARTGHGLTHRLRRTRKSAPSTAGQAVGFEHRKSPAWKRGLSLLAFTFQRSLPPNVQAQLSH
jgi:DNA-directed RNA polymerase specialized sigma24 family protein